MVQVGIAHGRVLAHDVHAAHLVRISVRHQGLAHDFDHRVTVLIVQPAIPETLEPVMCSLVGNALVIGKHHGNQACVAGALHIVLPTQRVQSGTGPADLACHHAQRDQCPHIVGTVHVLTDTHAPENHCATGLGVGTRHLANGVRSDAANRRHQLRTEGLH